MTERNYQGYKNKTEILKEYSDKFICKVQNEKGKEMNVEVMSLTKLLEEFK